MKNNYYNLQKKNSINKSKKRKSKNNPRVHKIAKLSEEEKMQSNYRKRKAKKLNYKKVFIALIIFIILLYLICSGFGKIISKIKKSKQSKASTSVSTSVEAPKDISINMAVIGDIMCHSSNFKDAYNSETDSYDFSYVFDEIKNYLITADIAVGNLETTFAGKNAVYSGYPNFNTPEQLATDLVELGLDVVSTANNHSLDKLYAGVEGTINELDKVGLAHTGTYKSKEAQDTIITKNVNGINIAFLSFTYGTNGIQIPQGKEYCINLIDKTLITDQISKAKALNPDLICVFMHWGEEYKLQPNQTQKDLADFLFENGVDIILGSHPHVLESMEKRTITLADGTKKDGFLIYSLGNFVSGQVIENTRNSIILQLAITKHANGTISIDSYKYVPIYMYDKGEGQAKRYKILDVNKNITKYDDGNAVISEDLYNKLVSTKNTFDKVLAGN